MRKTLVLDTNLLVLLAVGLANSTFIARHKRLYPTYRKEHFDRLRDVVERVPALATTTHVLTEASNLLRQCADPMRSEIMATLGRLIKTSPELTPKASGVVATPEFLRLGLTDAALAALDHKRFRILSADLDLVVAMKKRGFEVANFQRLLFD